MGAPDDSPSLALNFSLNEHDHEWQLIHSTYADARRFMEGQARQCPQVGEADDEACQACLMFMSRALACTKDEHDARRLWPLSKIVSTCGSNLYDFFRELPVKAAVLEPFLTERDANWQQIEASNNIREWQKMLISLTLLSKKFKDLALRFIPSTPVPRQAVLRFGWFLFLSVKAKLLPPFPDLVSCMTVLTCVVNVLVTHAPSLPECLLSQQQQGQPLDTLQAICTDLKLDISSLSLQMAAVDSLISHMLPSAVSEWRTSDKAYPAPAERKTHCAFFSGLLTNPSVLQHCIEGLDREYGSIYQKKGEIDEREFLVRDFSTMASPRLSPTSLYNAAKRVQLSAPAVGPSAAPPSKQSVPLGPGAFVTVPAGAQQRQPTPAPGMRCVPPGLQSPVPTMRLGTAGPGCTPVTEAMAAASWLRGTVADAPAEPSQQLHAQLEAVGGAAMVQLVCKRAWQLAEAAMPDERPSGAASVMGFPHVQSSLHAMRRAEAVKLYYVSLDAVVAGERSSGEEAVKVLLGAVKFHKGLMACCLEVIIASFKMASCNFPHVLDRLKLKAFDLSKVIQPFVKYMPSLPRELKRHLFVIEERILESLAWEPASPLYNLIVQAAAHTNRSASSASAGSATVSAAPVVVAMPATPATSAQSPAPSCSEGGVAAEEVKQLPEVSSVSQDAGAAATAVSDVVASAASGDEDVHMSVGGASPPRRGSAAPSPVKRSHSGLQDLASPSPMKKARCERQSLSDSGIAPIALVLPEPLPLAVGKPVTGLLQEFLCKVVKIMNFRLALMVDSFDFSPLDAWPAFQSIMEVLEHALYHQTHLFYNRHVDQIVLSALYGYCKVHKLNKVSFKEIIAQYKRQPQATQAVFRSVNLEQVNPGLIPRGQADIIAFYNQCFVPVMKPFLLKTAQDANGTPLASAQQHGGQAPHLGLPPIPPHPKHGPHMRARRMSSPAPPGAPPCVPAAATAPKHPPLQRSISAGTSILLQAVQNQPPAPAPQAMGIQNFFPQLHVVNGRPSDSSAAKAPSSTPVPVLVGSSSDSQHSDQDCCEPMQTGKEAAPSLVVGGAQAALTRPGGTTGPDASGILKWISASQQPGFGAAAANGRREEASTAAGSFAAPVTRVVPPEAMRSLRKMPSGIAALLQALDSAEAQSGGEQRLERGSGETQASDASPAGSLDNSRMPCGVEASCKLPEVAAAVLPSAASPSSDDSSSPRPETHSFMLIKPEDRAASCSDQSCTPHVL